MKPEPSLCACRGPERRSLASQAYSCIHCNQRKIFLTKGNKMTTKAFGMMDAYKFGFRTLGKNFLLILGVIGLAGLVIGAITLGIHAWIMPLQTTWDYNAVVTSASFEYGFSYLITPVQPIDLTPAQALMLLAALLTLLTIGLVSKMFFLRIGLDSYEGINPTVERLKATIPFVGTFYLTMFLIYFVTVIGFILLIIPGFIFLIKYGFADFVVLDSDLGPIEAMKRSSAITYGHKWRLFGFYALSFLFISLSSIIIVGPMIFLFVFLFSRAYVYRKLVEDREEFEPIPQNM